MIAHHRPVATPGTDTPAQDPRQTRSSSKLATIIFLKLLSISGFKLTGWGALEIVERHLPQRHP
jgi:hypothetical protein